MKPIRTLNCTHSVSTLPQPTVRCRFSKTQDIRLAQPSKRHYMEHISLQTSHTESLNKLVKELNIRTQEDWYNIQPKDIENFSSICTILSSAYPQYIWHPWRFSTSLHTFWVERSNQRKYIDWLADELNIETQDDWNYISHTEVTRRGGSALLNIYGNSLFKTLSSVYPEFEWSPCFGEAEVPRFWSSVENQRKFLDWFAFVHGIEEPHHWYGVTGSSLKEAGGARLFFYYDSVFSALQAVYPEQLWLPWLFSSYPATYWNSPRNQRRYFEWLADKIDIQNQEQWYKVTREQLIQEQGKLLLQVHGNSLIRALEAAYPELDWFEWRFQNNPHGFWEDKRNQRKFLETLAKDLNITTQQQWYDLSIKDIIGKGGRELLQLYNDSPLRMYDALLPEYQWYPWTVDHTPPGYWEDIKNRRKYFDWYANTFGIRLQSDWYKVSHAHVMKNGGRRVVFYHGFSFVRALSDVYPEYSWNFWQFKIVPKRFWDDPKEQRKYLDWLMDALGLSTLDDWYGVTLEDIKDTGGRQLIERFNNCFVQTVTSVYKEHDWKIWKFQKVPTGFWNNIDNVRSYLEWFADQVGVTQPEDWYHVSHNLLGQFCGYSLIKRGFADNLYGILSQCFPEYKFEESMFDPPAKSQHRVYKLLCNIFPHITDIQMNYKHPQLQFSHHSKKMELDVFIPSLSLAIEYQGKHHYYHNTMYGFQSQKRDTEKFVACMKAGITLLEIPYWWDQTKESLVATIHRIRPDIISDPGPGMPIPEIEPFDQQLHLSSGVQPLWKTNYQTFSAQSSTGCWMTKSESCVPVLWDGINFQLSNGMLLTPPPSLLKQLPYTPLIGMLSLE